MPGFRLLGEAVNHYKQRTISRIYNVKDVVFRGGIVAVVASVIIWIAIFLYVAFYYAYMPSISHSRPVYLQFKSCEETQGICSFPSAHVQLTRRQQLLMIGQSYKLFINLEMPESPANKGLGMFMVCVQMRDKGGILVANSCRSAMLHYRSSLLHTLSTLFFSPFMIYGTAEEKQSVYLELFSDFEEDQNHPVTDIYVEIQTRHVELYSSTLHINAHFTGLRYLMFHWPVLSAAVGISSNLFFIVLICMLSWWHLSQAESNKDSVPFSFGTLEQEERTSRKDIFTFKGESDDSSFEDASFMDDTKLNEGDLELSPREFIKELTRSESFHLVGEQSEC